MSILPVNLFQRIANGGGAFAAVGPPAGFPAPNSPTYFGPAGNALVLWLDSLIGLSGADGSNVTSWPDQSGNAYDAGNAGSSQQATLQKSTGVQTPNGGQTVRFYGRDNPNQCILGNAGPNPYPSIVNGYTWYFMFYLLAGSSSNPTIELLWDESGSGGVRFVPYFNGTMNYRNQAGDVTSLAPAVSQNAWHTMRVLYDGGAGGSPTVTVNLVFDSVMATFGGAHTHTITPNVLQGYTLANLLANEVVGFNGYLAEVLWYSTKHTVAQQVLVDNWMRQRFGLPLVTQ